MLVLKASVYPFDTTHFVLIKNEVNSEDYKLYIENFEGKQKNLSEDELQSIRYSLGFDLLNEMQEMMRKRNDGKHLFFRSLRYCGNAISENIATYKDVEAVKRAILRDYVETLLSPEAEGDVYTNEKGEVTSWEFSPRERKLSYLSGEFSTLCRTGILANTSFYRRNV